MGTKRLGDKRAGLIFDLYTFRRLIEVVDGTKTDYDECDTG